MKKITLVLGGGSALGLAHIGVIQSLTKHYEISAIVGTSMGAIIGGCYASGLSPEKMLQLSEDISLFELLNPRNLDFRRKGIFDGKVVLRLFEEWTNGMLIEDAPIPFMAVAYDLGRKTSVLFNRGPFSYAMRASSSLPLIFAPFSIGDYLLVDGGVSHPLPLAFAVEYPSELTIAVNVLEPVPSQAVYFEEGKAQVDNKLDRMNILLETLSQNQSNMALQAIVEYNPDIVIDAHHPQLNQADITKGREFYLWGKQRALEALAQHQEPDFRQKLKEFYLKLLAKN
ncbi:MAG: patatin-like phospholipase family protein [Candidatus Cloacimonetes bacterium]|nr:patatin-like phospholipase family protein [Candidatus Cloacimonadota bacterium]